ncbi:MAG: CHAD domain-containing protein [Egibacteraceae bacterium]
MRSQFFIALPDGLRLDEVVRGVAGGKAFAQDRERTVERTYYDTFDWRLYRAGLVLAHDVAAGEAWLEAARLSSGEPAGRVPIAKVPRFASDLPDGELQRDLAPVVDVRALLPLVTTSSHVRVGRILDADSQTVLSIEEEAVRSPESPGGADLGRRLRLFPQKGRPKPLRRWLSKLRDDFGLVPGEDDLYRRALSSVGRRPGDYSSKLTVPMPSHACAGEAFRRVMDALLEALLANEEGVRHDVDSEFLHDFRVAIRRARSILSSSRGALEPAAVEQLRPELVWLQGATGRARDLDVYLLDLPSYAASLPPGTGPHLEPLRKFLEGQRGAAYAELGQQLATARYRAVVTSWRGLGSGTTDESQRSASEVASDRIWRAYRRAARQGRAIDSSTAAAELHELRKRCKRLRYLLEGFRELSPPKHVNRLVGELKALQSNLGEFQDCEVQAGDLQRFARQMSEEGVGSADTLSTMSLLVDQLGDRQRRARQAFAATFTAFDAPDNRTRFRKLFAPG